VWKCVILCWDSFSEVVVEGITSYGNWLEFAKR
jgi:hypothetical protein